MPIKTQYTALSLLAIIGLCTVGMILPENGFANTYTLSDNADAYVYQLYSNGTYSYGAYGSSGTLQAYNNYYTNPTGYIYCYTFLKFDLSSIPAGEQITGATLHLYANNYLYLPPYTPADSGLYYVAGDTWTESGINWSNKPGAGAELATMPLASWPSTSGWGTWNLFQNSNWNPTPDQSDHYLSLLVRSDASVAGGEIFVSREAGFSSNHPYLEITTQPAAPVPEPATMLLLGSGLIGLVGYGRKKSFKK